MSLQSRKTIREQVAAGLTTALSSVTPAPDVYDYMRTGFEGRSPIVRVWSESSDRPESVAQMINTRFVIDVQVWVLVDENGTVAEQAASEDTLDAIEYVIAEWVEANQQNAYWNQVKFSRPSFIQTTLVGSYTYIVETLALEVLAGD